MKLAKAAAESIGLALDYIAKYPFVALLTTIAVASIAVGAEAVLESASPVGAFVSKQVSPKFIVVHEYNSLTRENEGRKSAVVDSHEVTIRTPSGLAVVKVTEEEYQLAGPGWSYADWKLIPPAVEAPAPKAVETGR